MISDIAKLYLAKSHANISSIEWALAAMLVDKRAIELRIEDVSQTRSCVHADEYGVYDRELSECQVAIGLLTSAINEMVDRLAPKFGDHSNAYYKWRREQESEPA